jgi:F-type H+-transporting ATPase subunit delta
VISSAIFVRDAHAMADVVLKGGDEVAAQRDLDKYREIFYQVPALLEALDSPAVPREAKEKVLSSLLQLHPATPMVRNFLRLLLDHHRIRHFAEICDAYVRTVNDRKGVVAARVTSAAPLSAPEQARLRASLSVATGKQVNLTAAIDPDQIAGVIVQIGSTVYDGSIRTQLQEMRKRLARE